MSLNKIKAIHDFTSGAQLVPIGKWKHLYLPNKNIIMKEYSKSKLNRVKRGAVRATYNVEKINTILDAGFIGYVSYIFNRKAIAIPMAYGRKSNKIILHSSNANRMLTTLLKVKEMSMTVMHLDALVLARSGFHHSVNYRSVTRYLVQQKRLKKRKKKTLLYSVLWNT